MLIVFKAFKQTLFLLYYELFLTVNTLLITVINFAMFPKNDILRFSNKEHDNNMSLDHLNLI